MPRPWCVRITGDSAPGSNPLSGTALVASCSRKRVNDGASNTTKYSWRVVPGALSRLPAPPDSARVQYAHADWAGYSIFEEAFTLGHRAGSRS